MSNAKYQIDTQENRDWLAEDRDTLWRFGVRFPAPGGSAYYLGDDGTPMKERARECYETARMAHSYSLAYLYGVEGAGELADAALRGLAGEMHDQNADGWYAGIFEDGSVLEGKLCYAHAFVILAATSGVLAGREGAEELLEHALQVYDRFFWNEEEGLAADNWDTGFTKLSSYRGLNANMHSVEAFLAVADTTGREEYRVRAGRMIDHVLGWAKQQNWRIPEHFDANWNADLNCNKEKPADPFKPYGATPGHGIEWSRLITQWALSAHREDPEKAAPYIEAAENLFNRAVEDAWNADGAPGICYTTDWDGTPVVHDRMHWTLAEAINTAAVLYRVTGKQVYADRYAEFMAYLDEKVLDHMNGSWFHQLDRENQVMDTVWPGKPDLYHALQSTLIPYEDPSLSICAAVKKSRSNETE